jgi:hypothetical protein
MSATQLHDWRICAGGRGRLRECLVRSAMQLVWTVGRLQGSSCETPRISNGKSASRHQSNGHC